VRARVTSVPGILRVIPSDELSLTSPDAFVRAAALSYLPARSGDIAIVPDRNWMLVGRASMNATSHGSPQDHDKRVPLILFGGGIRSGRYAQNATPADIAPTLASLIDLPLPRAEGRVLREALRSAH
jgi:hypothetical protein